jgi:hypothetical protein
VPNFSALPGPGSAPFPGTGGGKHSRSSIVFVKRADKTKCDERMADQDRRINQRGPSGGQHVARNSDKDGRKDRIDGLIGHTDQDGPGG